MVEDALLTLLDNISVQLLDNMLYHLSRIYKIKYVQQPSKYTLEQNPYATKMGNIVLKSINKYTHHVCMSECMY